MLGSHQTRNYAALRRDRRLRRTAGVHRRASEDVFIRDVHASRLCRRHPRRSRRPAGRRGARRRRRGVHAQVPRQVRRVQASREDDPAGDPLARSRRALLRRGAVARCRTDRGPGDPKRSWAPTSPTSSSAKSGSWRRPMPERGSGRRRSCRPRSGVRRAARQPHRDRDRAGGHVPGRRRTLGIARGRDHRGRARRRRREPVTSFIRRPRRRAASRLRAPLPIDDFVVGIGIFNAEGVCCYGTNTAIEELDAEWHRRRRRGDLRHRHASISSRGPTSSTSPSTSATATPTTITGCSTPSA